MLTDAAIDLYAATKALLILSGYTCEKTQGKIKHFNGGKGLNEITVLLTMTSNLESLKTLDLPQRGHLITIVSLSGAPTPHIILYASNAGDTLLLLSTNKEDTNVYNTLKLQKSTTDPLTLLRGKTKQKHLAYPDICEMIKGIYGDCIPRLPSDNPLPLSNLKTFELSLANIGKSDLRLQDHPTPQKPPTLNLLQTIPLEETASDLSAEGELLLFQLVGSCIKAGLFIVEINHTSTNLKTATLMHPLTRQYFTLVSPDEFAKHKKLSERLSKAPEKIPTNTTYLSFAPSLSDEKLALFIATTPSRKLEKAPADIKNLLNFAYKLMGISINEEGQYLLLTEHASPPPPKKQTLFAGFFSYLKRKKTKSTSDTTTTEHKGPPTPGKK